MPSLLFRLVGLSNYLVVCLVCMILVKRATGILARLQVPKEIPIFIIDNALLGVQATSSLLDYCYAPSCHP